MTPATWQCQQCKTHNATQHDSCTSCREFRYDAAHRYNEAVQDATTWVRQGQTRDFLLAQAEGADHRHNMARMEGIFSVIRQQDRAGGA